MTQVALALGKNTQSTFAPKALLQSLLSAAARKSRSFLNPSSSWTYQPLVSFPTQLSLASRNCELVMLPFPGWRKKAPSAVNLSARFSWYWAPTEVAELTPPGRSTDAVAV